MCLEISANNALFDLLLHEGGAIKQKWYCLGSDTVIKKDIFNRFTFLRGDNVVFLEFDHKNMVKTNLVRLLMNV